MEASTRHLEPERGQLGRRKGHVPQISISDDNHHVTEAIGDMYGDNDWNNRPNSFASSTPQDDPRDLKSSAYDTPLPSVSLPERSPSKLSTEQLAATGNGSPPLEGRRRQSSLGSMHGGSPPPKLSRTNSADTANQAFPLNDIDYESSPAAVAQELSNLQAIRRMSMNVDVADPDLPTFGPSFAVPPSPSAGEDDASRMFWVPARLHPELAPTEFKTFVEDRVDRIKRRSGDESTLSPDGLERRRSSGTSLSRRKSMLSRTIESPVGWEDGADVLERKKSRTGSAALDVSETTLQELEQLVTDPTDLVRKMSIDSTRRSLEGLGPDAADDADIPILPTAPGGQALKRSTRTNYRRGSLRRGERVALSRRVAQRLAEGGEQEEQAPASPTLSAPRLSDEAPEPGLSRVQTEPTREASDSFVPVDRRAPQSLQSSTSLEEMHSNSRQSQDSTQYSSPSKQFQSRLASNGRTTAPVPAHGQLPQPVPQIIETPPHETWQATQPPPFNHVQNLPERKSSHEYSRQNAMYHRAQERAPPLARPPVQRKTSPSQTLDDMANSPSLLLGTSTRTDALSFIPTFNPTDERKPERKSKDKRDSSDSSASRKPTWGWLLGSQSQDSDKERRAKEEREMEPSKKSKLKAKPPAEKAHDSTRLDVLKTATDGSRGRESLVLDRDSFKLEEERKKESSRKSGGAEPKKETGLFSSLFGGGKKKTDREGAVKRPEKERRPSPDPTPRLLRADIDYNWTRFSILEERAIYRMAHIKLANPRRALCSQVLLSNFMYSYLAKVQQMHPQIQIPQFATQRQHGQKVQGQDEQQHGDAQSDEFAQWQRYQEQQEKLAQADGASQHQHAASATASPTFIDDYDPEHQRQEDTRQQYGRGVNGNGNNGGVGVYGHGQGHGQQTEQAWQHRDMYSQQGLFDNTRPPEGGDLW